MRGDWRAHGTTTSTCPNTTLVTVAEKDTLVFILANIVTLSANAKIPIRLHEHCIQIDACRTVTMREQSHNDMMLEIGALPGYSPYRAGIQIHEERSGKVFHPFGIFWPQPLGFALWTAFMLQHANATPLFFGLLKLK